MPTYTRLKGVTNISDYTLSDQLENNIVEFFNWGLLGIGAFFNVSLSNEDESRLRLVNTPDYNLGQVWEPFRNNLVYETDIEYTFQPIAISGVYVDDVFYSSAATGAFAHHIDYTKGRVVFDSAISADSEVRMEYSYKYFYLSGPDKPWFRQLMYDSFNITDQDEFLNYGSGIWSIISDNRVQLPCIVVEADARRNFEGYQIGGGQKVMQDVLFHIITQEPWDRKSAIDIVTFQNEKTIKSFDKNLVFQQNKGYFKENGDISPSGLSYPELIAPTGEGGCYWKNIDFSNMSSQGVISVPPLYRAIVRGTATIILGEL